MGWFKFMECQQLPPYKTWGIVWLKHLHSIVTYSISVVALSYSPPAMSNFLLYCNKRHLPSNSYTVRPKFTNCSHVILWVARAVFNFRYNGIDIIQYPFLRTYSRAYSCFFICLQIVYNPAALARPLFFKACPARWSHRGCPRWAGKRWERSFGCRSGRALRDLTQDCASGIDSLRMGTVWGSLHTRAFKPRNREKPRYYTARLGAAAFPFEEKAPEYIVKSIGQAFVSRKYYLIVH